MLLYDINDTIKKEGVKVEKYKIGDIVEGKITGITKYGIFINLPNGYNGLIHISEISDNYVRNINDYVENGETIKAKIIGIEDAKKQLNLSIKGINYKLNTKEYHKLVETKTGFTTLNLMLKKWINSKITEINHNNSKKA